MTARISRFDQFITDEWKMVRAQIDLILQAIWRLESGAIVALAAYYAWHLTTIASLRDPQLAQTATILVGPLFLYFVRSRLQIEYAILMTLGKYSAIIERYQYDDDNIDEIIGWEHFLKLNPPDEIVRADIGQFYSHTFRCLRYLLYLTVLYSAVILIKFVPDSWWRIAQEVRSFLLPPLYW